MVFDLIRDGGRILFEQSGDCLEGHALAKAILNFLSVLHREMFVLFGVRFIVHGGLLSEIISQSKFNHKTRRNVNPITNPTVGVTLGIYLRHKANFFIGPHMDIYKKKEYTIVCYAGALWGGL